MQRLILVTYKEGNKSYKELFYNDYQCRSTIDGINPQFLKIVTLQVCGKTYADKQKFLRALAARVQMLIMEESDIDLSINEISDIFDWFERTSSQLGLLKEFRQKEYC